MTLHSAKGLEFDTVFLPGWEEGLFPHQRTLDESGRAGLEEERRLAYVGITRAASGANISFAPNRRIHGLWQSAIPSRFVDELPEAHVDVAEAPATYGGYGAQRRCGQPLRPPATFANTTPRPAGSAPRRTAAASAERRWAATATSPGRIRTASARSRASWWRRASRRRRFELLRASASSTRNSAMAASPPIDGNKLTIDFDKAGRKRVLDSFVERH